MPVQITAIGHVQTVASVAVRPRVDGQITEVRARDGQEVKAGDVLFELDDRQARAVLAQAKGNLARDQAQLGNARREVERLSPLAQKAFASRQQLDQAQANAAALEGTVHADEGQVADAEAQLSYTVIRAPIDGKLGTINYKEGNAVQANTSTPLVTINQMRPIYVSLSVPQRALAGLQKAMAAGPLRVTVTIPGDEGEPQQGTLAYLENAIDPATGTLTIKAEFANAQGRLWPGQFVNAVITLSIEPKAIVVPSTAVQSGQKGNYVFVIKPDSTVEPRPVVVDRTVGEQTIIAQGVRPGERVVTSGQLRLTAGTRVRVQAPASASPQEAAS
jgi:multidrug efflux system membrane fusion protein